MSQCKPDRRRSKTRCSWVNRDPLYIAYHDEEWGVPVLDSRQLFEMLCLEGAQAGLSWYTILKKRDHYRMVFDGFDPVAMARYSEARKAALLDDPGIVRNRLKVEAFVCNARSFLAYENGHGEGSFSALLWAFVDGTPIVSRFASDSELAARSECASAMSGTLKKLGFKFVGSTICYAFMQASGMVNDHEAGCFRAVSRRRP